MKSKEQSEITGAEIYRCWHCGGVLGVTTISTLYVGPIRHKRHITFDCGYCEKETFWKPSDEKSQRTK
jgi:hypothetical protein